VLAQKNGNQTTPTQVAASKQGEENKKVPNTELRRLYERATSEYERRAICLQAIDQGAIFRTGPVSAIDEIFGTNFGSNLPTKKEIKRTVVVHFAQPTTPVPSPDGRAVARGYTGWFLVVEYDYNGDIQNYYLTNLHK